MTGLVGGALVTVGMVLPAVAQTGPGFLRVDGGALYFEECGHGPAIVLLHDGLLHSITWDAVWPDLCRRYHVLRYDRRGMGRSPPATAPFVPADDLAELLRDRHVDRATLIGSSSGSGLAIDFALRHP